MAFHEDSRGHFLSRMGNIAFLERDVWKREKKEGRGEGRRWEGRDGEEKERQTGNRALR